MQEPLGKVNVEIGADTTKLVQGVKQAETEVQKLDKAGKSLTGTFNAAQKAMRRLFIPAAIAAGIAGVTRKVIDLITTTQQLQTEFNKVEDAARGISQALRVEQFGEIEQQGIRLAEQFNARMEDARRQAEEFRESTKGWWLELFGLSDVDAQLSATIRNIQKEQEQAARLLSQQIEKQQEEAAKREAKRIDDRIKQLGDAARRLQVSLLPDADKIEAEYSDAIDAAIRGVRDAGLIDDEATRAALDRYLKFLDRKAEADRAALKERLDNEEKAEREKNERVAKANADAFEREMQRAIRSINGSLGANFTSITQLTSAIGKVATEIQRRNRI